MNYRIIFIYSNGKEETLAEFTFSGDMVALFTSNHFQKEYKDLSTKMQIREMSEITAWKIYNPT